MKMDYDAFKEADKAFNKANKNGDVRCSICNEQIFKNDYFVYSKTRHGGMVFAHKGCVGR